MSLPERPAAYIRVVGARNARDPHVRDQARAVLAQLAGYLTSGRHDAIIVADLSRISRDPAEVLAFTVRCDRCRVTLEALEEGHIDEDRIAALYARYRVIKA